MTRRWLVRSLYLLAALCLVVGLSPLGRARSSVGPRVVVLLDVSRSVMDDASRDFPRLSAYVEPFLHVLDSRSRVWLEAYARRPLPWIGPISPAEAIRTLARNEQPMVPPADVWSSRPDRALGRASALLGAAPGGHVLLITDGQGWGPVAEAEASALAAHGHRLWVAPSPLVAADGDLFLDRVGAPIEVRPGASVPFRIRVGGTGTTPRRFRVAIQEMGNPESKTVGQEGLWPGQGESVLDLVVPARTGETVRRFTVHLEEPGGPSRGRATPADRAQVAVRVGAPVLLQWIGAVGTSPPEALAGLGPGFAVDPARFAAATAAQLDVIVVEDVPYGPSPLTEGTVQTLEQVVSRGIGLLALGGRRSFGPGRWGGTGLETMLPVRMEPPGSTRDITLLLDASGSMASENRWRRAMMAVRAFASSLGSGDRVRVLAFSARVQELVPWTLVPGSSEVPGRPEFVDRIAASLSRIRPHGATRLVHALDSVLTGFSGLERAGGESTDHRRRLLLLCDGQLGEGPGAYQDLGRRLEGARIEVGVVATGASLEADGLVRFEALTLDGQNGRVIRVRDEDALEDAFQRAGQPDRWLSGDLAVRTTEVPLPSGLVLSTSFPHVGLLIRVSLKRPGGTCLAVGPEESPVLVVGRFGEGRVAAFPAGLREPNSRGWNQPDRWKELLRWLARREPGASRRARGVARIRQDHLQVHVRVPAGSDVSGWRIRFPDRTWNLEPRAPGQLEASGPSVATETDAPFLVIEKDGQRAGVIPMRSDPGEELRRIGSNPVNLDQLARAGNGQVLANDTAVSRWHPGSGTGDPNVPDPVWPLLALALFVAGWTVNRVRG